MVNIGIDNGLDHIERPLKADGEVLPLDVSSNKIVYPKNPTDQQINFIVHLHFITVEVI